MADYNSNDISDAKRRVEEMRKKAQGYVDTQNTDKGNYKPHTDSSIQESQPSFLSDVLGSLFSNQAKDNSAGLILSLILILSKEGADNKLILALLYILL
ncbi:hypothetical protein [Eubacterium sp.]|uniref:hypothetical protein n=1 Tax=Eubacterium sp. TaxID=142586 RepID=UPI003F052742